MMIEKVLRNSAGTIVLVALAFGMVGSTWAGDGYLSPVALVADQEGRHLYVVEYSANQIAVFDIEKATVTKTISLPDSPSGVTLAPGGSTLFVTGDTPSGKVYAINVETGKTSTVIAVGHSPTAPVASPDGKTLFVCNRFENDVSAIDVQSEKEVARIPVSREPVAAAITPDGKHLVVANHLPAGRSDGDYTSAVVSIVSTDSREVTSSVSLPNGSTGLRGVCVSPDGKFAYVTHILGRYHLPTTQLERGWMNTNALSVIDVVNGSLVNTVLLDSVDEGAANPWGIVCSEDGKFLCVTHAGTHEVTVIDRAGLHEKLDSTPTETSAYGVTTVEDVPNDLAFLVYVRRQIPLLGNGPRGLALVGTHLYAAEYFSDSLGVVDIAPDVRPRPKSIPLGPIKELSLERKGEMFFCDANLCFQHWQSCSSCHPDGRADALNWDLLNDGMGNPKNTKSMLLAHQTPPSMMTGVRADAETAVRSGIKFIQFAVRPEEDAVAIDTYLKALKPVPSPHLVDGELSESANRGRGIFEKVGCTECHPGPLFTDLMQYDVGTGTGNEEGRAFDTPTLVEVWRTAPYFYDGRASTLKEVLCEEFSGERHNVATSLGEENLADLLEFLLSN